MKCNKHILLPMMLALLSVATSCEQEELPPALPDSDMVEVTAAIGSGAESRVSQRQDNVYTFEDGDKIHVVGWYGDWTDYNKPWETASDTWWNDAVSTYNGYKWKTEPYMRWQNGESLTHNFVAWWPENFVKSTDNLTAVPVTLTGDYEKDDILSARWSGTRPDNNTLALQFNHLMARFDLRLNFGNQYPNVTDVVAKTEMVNIGILDLLTPQCQPNSGSTTWQTFKPLSISNAYDWNGTTICMPQEVRNLKIILSFKTDGQQKELTYTHPNLIHLDDNRRTTLVLQVGNDIVGLVDVAVTDWIESTLSGGEAEEQ